MKQKPTRLSYGLFHTLSLLCESSKLRAPAREREGKKRSWNSCKMSSWGAAGSAPLLAELSIHHATYTLLSQSAARVVLCLAHISRGAQLWPRLKKLCGNGKFLGVAAILIGRLVAVKVFAVGHDTPAQKGRLVFQEVPWGNVVYLLHSSYVKARMLFPLPCASAKDFDWYGHRFLDRSSRFLTARLSQRSTS